MVTFESWKGSLGLKESLFLLSSRADMSENSKTEAKYSIRATMKSNSRNRTKRLMPVYEFNVYTTPFSEDSRWLTVANPNSNETIKSITVIKTTYTGSSEYTTPPAFNRHPLEQKFMELHGYEKQGVENPLHLFRQIVLWCLLCTWKCPCPYWRWSDGRNLQSNDIHKLLAPSSALVRKHLNGFIPIIELVGLE